MKVPLNLGRQYIIWSKEAKAMFDSEFSDYLSNDYGYPSALVQNQICPFIYNGSKFL